MSVTKNKFLNIAIGLLVIATLLLMCKPCYFTENDSTSVMGYICMPTSHEEITALMKETDPDFVINGHVVGPIVLFLLGIASIVLMLSKRNMTISLLGPMIFSVCGIIICWTNELMRVGGVTTVPTVVMLAILALCILNGSWGLTESADQWKSDPQAKGKLKEIEKAVSRKKLETLKAYAKSTDLTVRAAAIEGIGKVGGPEAFQPLVAQLSCTEPEIRIAAANALGNLGDQRGRTYILHFMAADRDSRVRSAMRKALASLPSQSAAV